MTKPWERNSRPVMINCRNVRDCPICRHQIDLDHDEAILHQRHLSSMNPQFTLPPAWTNPTFTIPPVGPVDPCAETTVVDFDLVN